MWSSIVVFMPSDLFWKTACAIAQISVVNVSCLPETAQGKERSVESIQPILKSCSVSSKDKLQLYCPVDLGDATGNSMLDDFDSQVSSWNLVEHLDSILEEQLSAQPNGIVVSSIDVTKELMVGVSIGDDAKRSIERLKSEGFDLVELPDRRFDVSNEWKGDVEYAACNVSTIGRRLFYYYSYCITLYANGGKISYLSAYIIYRRRI